MSSSSFQSGASHQEHRDCGARERVWLPRERVAESSVAPHPICIRCGDSRSLVLPRAKPLGLFFEGQADLGGYTKRCVSQQKLADVQKRLIFERLSRREEFEEPHCTPGRVQMSTCVENVRLVWPNLDEALILNTLPVRSNKRRENSLPTVRFIMDKT